MKIEKINKIKKDKKSAQNINHKSDPYDVLTLTMSEVLFDNDKNTNGGGVSVGKIKSPIFLTYFQISDRDSPCGGTKVYWSKDPTYFNSYNYLGWFPYTAVEINTQFSRTSSYPNFISYTHESGWGIRDFEWIYSK